jgi:hypothetical protein
MKTTALPMVEDKDAQRVADALSNVLADTFGLYLKTHSFHRKDVRSRLLGSVAKSVLENAPCSVEVVRARRNADPTAARQIIAQAKHWGADLVVQSGLFARRMLHRPALRRHISRRKPRNGRGPQELMK